jgi:hypothetical protein
MTAPDPERYVNAGLNAEGKVVYVARDVIAEDGLVEMRHPNLPEQPIRVFPGGVAARMLAGWAPVEPEPLAEAVAEMPVEGPPPKGGAGSGVDAWAAYAASRGVEVPDGATREQIQSLLRDAGVPVEAEQPAEPEPEPVANESQE